MNAPSLRAYALLGIAILGWGFSTSLVEFGLDTGITPIPFLAYRFLLATLLMLPFALLKYAKEIWSILHNKWIWIIGISESGGLLFQYLGQHQQVPAGLAALLSLIFLLIVPFLSPFVLDEQINPKHMVAVAFGLAGVVFISTNGSISNLISASSGSLSIFGITLLLLAAFSYAIYIVAGSRYTTRENPKTNTFALFFTVLLIVSICSTILGLVVGWSTPTTDTWQWIIYLVIFSTLLPFALYFEALREISANMASVLLLLQVLVPFAIDFFVLGRRYSTYVLLGSGLIVIAMIIVVLLPYIDKTVTDDASAQFA